MDPSAPLCVPRAAPGSVSPGSVSPCPSRARPRGQDPCAPVPPQGLTVPTEHTDGANSPSRNRTHHFPLMKTRFTPTTIIPLFLGTAPCLREALLLFLLKKKKKNPYMIFLELIYFIIWFSFLKRKKSSKKRCWVLVPSLEAEGEGRGFAGPRVQAPARISPDKTTETPPVGGSHPSCSARVRLGPGAHTGAVCRRGVFHCAKQQKEK